MISQCKPVVFLVFTIKMILNDSRYDGSIFSKKITRFQLLEFCGDEKDEEKEENSRGVVFSIRIGLQEAEKLEEIFDKYNYLTKRKAFSLLIRFINIVLD